MSKVSLLAGGVTIVAFAASAIILASGHEKPAPTHASPPAATPPIEPLRPPVARVRPRAAEEETRPPSPAAPDAAPAPDEAPRRMLAESRGASPQPSPPPTWEEEEEELPDPEAVQAAVDAADLVHQLMMKRP